MTDVTEIRDEILAKLMYSIGKDRIVANTHDWLNATILALRDRIIDRWMTSTRDSYRAESKRVYYLSLEFLIGRLLRDALSNLELTQKECIRALPNIITNLKDPIKNYEQFLVMNNVLQEIEITTIRNEFKEKIKSELAIDIRVSITDFHLQIV